MINRLKGQYVKITSAEYHEWCPKCGSLDGISFSVDLNDSEHHFHCNRCRSNFDPESYLEAWEKAMSQP